MVGTITDQLLEFATAEVPQDVTGMIRLSLFDWAACGIAGAREADFAEFARQQRAMGQGRASVLGGGQTSAPAAALINGTLSHALDYDDTHFAHIGHPSVTVIPAVLALAEETRADLPAVIAAAAIGMEASVMVGLWLGREHYQTGFHQTATAGAFGATLGACRLLGLEVVQSRHALGLCASMASGIKAQFGTMGKPLNAGLAARSGIEAALFAQAGMTAAQDGLAGPLGFGPTHHGAAAEVPPARDGWHMLEVSHKFHACCHGLHAMLEALGASGLRAGEVAEMHIHTHPRWMSVCNIADPDTGLAAKFSYRQTAAMTLLGRDTGAADQFTDALAGDPEAVSLRQRITVSEAADLSETEARIDLRLADGSTRQLRHDLMAPMTLPVRAGKLQRKAAALLNRDRADALWEATGAQGLDRLIAQLVMS